MNDTRLENVSGMLRETQQLLDTLEWEGTGTENQVSYLEGMVKHYQKLLADGITLEPNF